MKILSNEMAQHYQVASLQRGHSVFTSFISNSGKILFLDSHLDRLLSGADFLFPNLSWSQCFEKLRHFVESEFSQLPEPIQNQGYFRLTIFDDCVYFQYRQRECLGQVDTSVKVMLGFKMKTPGLLPAFVKLSNYAEADLELRRARLLGFDDVLFTDHLQKITEASSSNIFLLTNDDQVLTPMPSSMVLDGILRKKLCQKLKESGFRVSESSISKTDLLKAKEIWLTNSVKGIRFVEQFDDSLFQIKNSTYERVVNIFGRYGELV